VKGLEARLADGEKVLCAEGYLLALCRMGYLKSGVCMGPGVHVHTSRSPQKCPQIICPCRVRHNGGIAVQHTSQEIEGNGL